MKRIYYGAVRIFRRTGVVVIAASVVVALLFPYFQDSPLNYAETAGTFLLLALPYGISYFLMGPNFVIMADQKEYRINIWIQMIAILRMVFMVVVIRLQKPFVWILIIEACNILFANGGARVIALKAYPWLKEKPADRNNHEFQKKAPYAMAQRLSELATTQTDNIVITAFMGYEMTSVYSTYSYLTDSISKITQSMVTSPMNSFGNLFNDKRADAYSIFTEFFNFAAFLSTVVATVIFIVMPQFVHIWLNKPMYEVSTVICLAFSLNIFYMTLRQPIIICRDANGLYVNARKNAVLLAVVKIVLSIVLIQQLGLLGVILATAIANWTVDFLYNPRLVYREVFHLPVRRYYFMVGVRLLLALVLGGGGYLVWQHMLSYAAGSLAHFVLAVLLLGVCMLAVTAVLYSLAFRSFRHLYVRLKSILQRRRGAR